MGLWADKLQQCDDIDTDTVVAVGVITSTKLSKYVTVQWEEAVGDNRDRLTSRCHVKYSKCCICFDIDTGLAGHQSLVALTWTSCNQA